MTSVATAISSSEQVIATSPAGSTSRHAGGRRRLWIGLTLALLWSASAAGGAAAATGTQLRSFTAANPEACGANVGLAFDGNDLIMSCLQKPVLDVLRPSDGSLIRQVQVQGHNGLAALAWDANRQRLWACNAPNGNSPGLDVDVYLVDPTNGSSVKAFTSLGCHDGLAYDGTDDTLWMGPDVSDTIYHYRPDGTLIASYSGLARLLGGTGKSGIAVGGSRLYLANDGRQSIYSVPKDVRSSTLVARFSKRLEDLECDNITFGPSTVIWSQDAFDRIVSAWQIPSGTCSFGGLPASPPPPVLGRAVNASPLSGKVFVKVPARRAAVAWDWSAGISAAATTPAPAGWVPLVQARQLPVGTEVDTRAGTARLVTASGRRRGTFNGNFQGAIFKVAQSRSGRDRGLTQLTLDDNAFPGGPNYTQCRAGRSADRSSANAARSLPRRTLQRLRGSARGRFRTRGRFASATVHGTDWGTADRCDGTLTIVRRGLVVVTDFRRHRSFILTAHHTYLARAR